MKESIIIELLNWLNSMPEISDDEERERVSQFLRNPYLIPEKFRVEHPQTEWDDYGTDIRRYEHTFLRKPLDIRIFNQLAMHLLPVNP